MDGESPRAPIHDLAPLRIAARPARAHDRPPAPVVPAPPTAASLMPFCSCVPAPAHRSSRRGRATATPPSCSSANACRCPGWAPAEDPRLHPALKRRPRAAQQRRHVIQEQHLGQRLDIDRLVVVLVARGGAHLLDRLRPRLGRGQLDLLQPVERPDGPRLEPGRRRTAAGEDRVHRGWLSSERRREVVLRQPELSETATDEPYPVGNFIALHDD